MHAVTPVTFTTPDGVERKLRATQGARLRIYERFGKHVQEVLNTYGDAAFADILFALMHDEKGKPPKGLTVEELRESLPMDSGAEIMAVIMAAFSQGKSDPNELRALLEKAMETQTQTTTGSSSTDSVHSASESPLSNSGGDSASGNSTPEPEPTAETATTSTAE
jgi:hypothetical protein